MIQELVKNSSGASKMLFLYVVGMVLLAIWVGRPEAYYVLAGGFLVGCAIAFVVAEVRGR